MLSLSWAQLKFCPDFSRSEYLGSEVESIQTKKLGNDKHHKDARSRLVYRSDASSWLVTCTIALLGVISGQKSVVLNRKAVPKVIWSQNERFSDQTTKLGNDKPHKDARSRLVYRCDASSWLATCTIALLGCSARYETKSLVVESILCGSDVHDRYHDAEFTK